VQRTLTYYPWQPATLNYGAGVTQNLSAWGFADEIPGRFGSQNADEMTLSIAGAALAASNFTYRSRLTLTCDGIPFFNGYITEDPRTFTGDKNDYALKVQGPWWYLENLTFLLQVNVVTGEAGAPPAPVLTPEFFTHFTLNESIVTTTPNGGISYTPTVLSSRDQLKAILDFAIARGAWLQYNYANLLNVPVLPRDVMNITCADAIRKQMEDVDAVCWFDHTQNPPMFNCERRVNLPAVSRSVAACVTPGANQARGFAGLKQSFDRAVPYVQFIYEQTNTVNGQPSIVTVSDLYPPLPAGQTQAPDQFKALLTTIPIRGMTATQTEKWIQTLAIDATTLPFWLLRKPEMNPAINANAAVEYNNLAITPGSSKRQSALPNMIILGGYADWMGGNHAEDNITAVCSYERRVSASVGGTLVASQTLRTRVQVTDLNYPAATLLSVTNVSPSSENPNAFVGLAQIAYEDLNAPQWEGEIPLFEASYTGTLVLGNTFNLTGGQAAWATMNALAQEISFTSKGGGMFYNIRCGPNKKISPAQLADKLRAKRLAYISVTSWFTGNNAGAASQLELESKQDNVSNGEPQKTQDHIYQGGGGILIQGNNGSPLLTLQTYDANGNPQTPASPVPGAVARLALGDIAPADVPNSSTVQLRNWSPVTPGGIYVMSSGIPPLGGTFADFYNNAIAYSAGSIVQVLTTTTIGGVTVLPGTYVLRQGQSVPANAAGNMVPQYPYPGGTIYWICLSMGISVVNTCSSGAGAQIYLNSSGSF
jgi:hypothetical protein